ncbi:bifunctional DNA-formamidopyrimidine glycosylase/DNA-(apurinic or apyrimidinic site) lyase [Patescibacteria group bacterium]
MPELPEVETIRRQLAKDIVGRTVRSVDVRFSGRINLSPKRFRAAVEGRRIREVGRRAKMLLLHLSGGKTLVVHLKMTGLLLLAEPDHEPGKHTHIVFRLSGGRVLFFDDVRKFGFVRLHETAGLEDDVFGPARLGVEPLGRAFTAPRFADCLARHARGAVKPLLLSQKCVVGVGNIYADETLWKSRIRPDRRAGSLSPSEARRLHTAIRDVLRESVRLGGTSFDTYRDAHGSTGGYVRRLKAYGREGKRCARCRGTMVKTRLGGRGTHWCRGCQK